MAAVVVNEAFDLQQLHTVLERQLPAYARPLFVRVLAALDITGTFKLRKQELLSEGYDPGLVRDPLFLHDPGGQRFVPLDEALFERLRSAALRL
jgi:fatty-acyl-CoA synthase